MKNKISYLAAATLLTYSSLNAVAQNLVRQQELKNQLLDKQHQITSSDNSNQASKKSMYTILKAPRIMICVVMDNGMRRVE